MKILRLFLNLALWPCT